MQQKRSPHEVLGLRPGADRDSIGAAYRRLIKQHHPDLAGGDADAAKEVIHAYRQLEREDRKLPVRVDAPPMAARGRWRAMGWLALPVAAALLWAVPWPTLRLIPDEEPVAGSPTTNEVAPALVARIAADGASVEEGVSEAERLGLRSEDLVIGYSRSCAADLKRLPGEALLDHCLAFDMAAANGQAAASPWLNPDMMMVRHVDAALRVLGDPLLAQARVRDIRRLTERERLLRG